MARKRSLVVVQFLVPVLDRRGREYDYATFARLRSELERLFGGWSLVSDRPLPGAWRNPETGEVERDSSWRYEVGLPAARLGELDALLARFARRIDQKAIWRVISGEGRAVTASEEP